MTNESVDREKKLSMALDEIIKTKTKVKSKTSKGRTTGNVGKRRRGGAQGAASEKDKGPGRNGRPSQGHGGRPQPVTKKNKAPTPKDRSQVTKASVAKVSKVLRSGRPIDPSTLTNLQVTIVNERAISPERERHAYQTRGRDWERGRRSLGRSPPPSPARVSESSRRLMSIERAPEYYTTSRSSGRDARMMH